VITSSSAGSTRQKNKVSIDWTWTSGMASSPLRANHDPLFLGDPSDFQSREEYRGASRNILQPGRGNNGSKPRPTTDESI